MPSPRLSIPNLYADLVRSLYEAFARGDVPSVLGAMAEDIEWHEAEGMPYGGIHHGPNGVVQGVFGPQLQDIPDFTVTPEELIASGDQVAVVARYRGTGAASGERLDLQVVHVFDVRRQDRPLPPVRRYREVPGGRAGDGRRGGRVAAATRSR